MPSPVVVLAAHSLAAGRRAVLGYGIGLAVLVVWVMALYPSVEAELADYMDAMPDSMKSLFGADDISDLTGFVYAEVFSLMGPIIVLALAITHGSALVAGEEQEGILALVLSTGVGRRAVLTARLAALTIEVVAVVAINAVALGVGTVLAGGGLGAAGVAAACVQLALLGVLFGTLALGVGAATGRRALGAGVALAAASLAYLVDVLAELVAALEPARVLSPFHWYAPSNPLVAGFDAGGIALLVGSAVVIVGAATVAFERRDVGA